MRKKKRKRFKKRWLVLIVPVSLIVVGILVMVTFYWDLTKQTVLLTKTVVAPYEPDPTAREFEHETWPTLPVPGENLGELKIPSLELAYPVVQGTHDEELKMGIGHYAGSLLPGQGGNVLLSGHRDTVFKKLENLKEGDQIVFSTPYGDYVYEAVEFQIVGADDKTVAVPKDYETLTLTTCYPFDFIGDAPDRYIVYTKFLSKTETAAIN
ncbi:class D sortase [Bacillus marasmi]|uniref:class D sortase n=1 Tax=Bacillus marasmi TaxID=1926279 RepID=UPI0011C85695|nr:class D sortase [Bacillus marasmi]